ncbi:peptidoglycan/LPS O-acetylase OafA/YrhL [Brevundimonas alba]|uniref:Peptidoglycan/LPS O-acetylase OafA/YrhL n=1 Tax=Brevundimonas alba TaxID=74314 RepID=A0A7X5YJV9_9CAUL|nr:acyltransferase family protein [Brevundimonas alba]NJC41292.1 peptidoglycan/LPS O-acetylase OafA/YrhL [Brevundimonas alba]
MTSAGGADGYRPEVDGLRAVAVVAVILFHTNLGLATGGYIGVDVFFVISGYLISSIILREMDQKRFTFVGFYERRIRRIFPALFVVLLATSVGSWFILPPEQMQTFTQSVVATTAFAANLFFWFKSGYFGGDAELFPLVHMWSLAVEEQYYVFFPFLVLIAAGPRKRWLPWLMAAVFAVSFAACVYVTRDHPLAAFFLTPMRAWELIAGVFVAMYQRPWLASLDKVRGVRPAIELTGAAAVLVSIFMFDSTTAFPGAVAAIPVLGTAALILTSSRTSIVGRVLASGPMVGVGLLSYSAYLWHQPLYALSRVYGLTERGPFIYAILIAATFVLAYLSWRFVEQPFRDRRRISRLRIYILFFILSGVLVAGGVAGHFAMGFPNRFDRETLALNATAGFSLKRVECHADRLNPKPPESACRYFTDKVHWAVLGDSHGVETAYVLAEELRPAGEGVLHLTYSACQAALTYESTNPGCSEWMRQSVAFLERAPEITDVVVVFRHSFHMFGDQTRSYPRVPNEMPVFLKGVSAEQARQIYIDSFSETVRRLSAAGKRVHVVMPIPELPTHVERYIFASDRSDPDRITGASMEFYRARNARILPVLRRLDSLPGVNLVDPTPAFCDEVQCRSIIDNQSMYYDDDHPSLAGARRWIKMARANGDLPMTGPAPDPNAAVSAGVKVD